MIARPQDCAGHNPARHGDASERLEWRDLNAEWRRDHDLLRSVQHNIFDVGTQSADSFDSKEPNLRLIEVW